MRKGQKTSWDSRGHRSNPLRKEGRPRDLCPSTRKLIRSFHSTETPLQLWIITRNNCIIILLATEISIWMRVCQGPVSWTLSPWIRHWISCFLRRGNRMAMLGLTPCWWVAEQSLALSAATSSRLSLIKSHNRGNLTQIRRVRAAICSRTASMRTTPTWTTTIIRLLTTKIILKITQRLRNAEVLSLYTF